MSYRCNKQNPCKHLSIDYEAHTMTNGDTIVSNPQWFCMARDDERCVPNCKLYESKEVRERASTL